MIEQSLYRCNYDGQTLLRFRIEFAGQENQYGPGSGPKNGRERGTCSLLTRAHGGGSSKSARTQRVTMPRTHHEADAFISS